MKKSAMMVNITWNRTGWTGIDINKDAGHKKVRDAPGHESLNFDFDKKGIDDKTWVHGYFQTHKTPIRFEDGGLIFFYSQDPQTQKKFLLAFTVLPRYSIKKSIRSRRFPDMGDTGPIFAVKKRCLLDFQIM